MILTTTDFIPGKEIAEVIDIARGSTVRARNIGRDIFAGLKNKLMNIDIIAKTDTTTKPTTN